MQTMDERAGDWSEPRRLGSDAGDKRWWPGQWQVIRNRSLRLLWGAGLGSQATGSRGGGARRRAGAGGWVGRRGFCWGTFHSGALDCGDLTACEGNPVKLMSRTEHGQFRVSVTRLCAYKQSFGGDDVTQGRGEGKGVWDRHGCLRSFKINSSSILHGLPLPSY